MKTVTSKIAAVLSLIIGVMAIVAGGQVLLGNLPDYYLIDWLPVYNFIVGILSATLTAFLIWKGHRLALPAALTTFGLHAVVMLILQTAYHAVVAPDSIRATFVRLTVWAIITGLVIAQRRIKNKGGLA